MEEETSTNIETSTRIVSRPGPILETDLEHQASTSTSTRLASEREQEQTGVRTDPKGVIGPWATRIQVIINQDTARAFQKYMADHDDFRPGKILGGLLSEFLMVGCYLERPPAPKCKHAETAWVRTPTAYFKKCAKCGVALD